MLCVCAVAAMSPGGVCTVGGSKGEDKCKTYYTGSHGSHLSPADVCGLLSRCHVPLFQHQETISPKQLPACLLPLQLFVSESTHLILYSYLWETNSLTTGGRMKREAFLKCCCFFLANSISLDHWCLSCPRSFVIFRNVLKLYVFLSHCDCCSVVHKTQIKLASMAASSALSTPMILNSHGHNNACDQPQHFIAIKPPWHAQFIIHFALSHCSHKDLHVALVLVCEEALWHPAWCTFTARMPNLKGEEPGTQMWTIWFAADTRCSE